VYGLGKNAMDTRPSADQISFGFLSEILTHPSFLSYPLCEHVYVIATEAGDETKNGDTRGASPWVDVHIRVVRPEGWSVHELGLGIRELERLRRENEAAMALLVGAVPEGRDAAADLARSTGISNREARRRKRVADVVGKVDGALEKLANGSVSEEHIAAMAPVADMPGACELLDGAESASPEEFANAVEQFRLSASCGDDMAKRQRARRALRFTSGPDGMIGLSGLLPPIEGTELKNRLAAVVDARWRADHPERASVLGGHGGDTHEQRMADALLAMTGVANSSGVGGSSSQDHQDQTTSVDSESREVKNRAGGSSWTPKQTDQFEQTQHVDLTEQTDLMGQPDQSEPVEQTQHADPSELAEPAEQPQQADLSELTEPSEQYAGLSEPIEPAEQTQRRGRSEPKEKTPHSEPADVIDLREFGQTHFRAETTGPAETEPTDAWHLKERTPSSSKGGSSVVSTFVTAPAAPITVVKTAKPAVVIVFDVDRWQARLAGGRPIPITESLLDQARNDLYYCFKNNAGEVLKFARSRRDPTPVERLALVVRDERCVYPGCHAPPEACEAHHTNEVVKDRGLTNVEVMALFCKSHHRHIHLNDLVVIRETDGTITIKKRSTGAVVAQTSQQKRAA
jgi:Domain of unknown function (DUF222)